MTCEHGFIGACADCDGCGQQPEMDVVDDGLAECEKCGRNKPVCCDLEGGAYCRDCCPAFHGHYGGDFQRTDWGWD